MYLIKGKFHPGCINPPGTQKQQITTENSGQRTPLDISPWNMDQ
jgi:hypothetical protein